MKFPDVFKQIGSTIDTKLVVVHVPGRHDDRYLLWPDCYVIEVIQLYDKTVVFLSSPVSDGVWDLAYGLAQKLLGLFLFHGRTRCQCWPFHF